MKFSIRYSFFYDVAAAVFLITYCIYSIFLGSVFLPVLRNRTILSGHEPDRWMHFPGWSGFFPGLLLVSAAAWFIFGVITWRYEILSVLSIDVLIWRKYLVIAMAACLLLSFIGVFESSPVARFNENPDREAALADIRSYTAEMDAIKTSFESTKSFWETLFRIFLFGGILRIYFLARR